MKWRCVACCLSLWVFFARAAEPVRTGLFVGNGPMGHSVAEWIRLTHSAPELNVTLMDAKSIRAGALDTVDLLIMPGGSSIRAKADIGGKGIRRLKLFLLNGGGYIGTCAGLSLLMDENTDPERGVGIIPYRRDYVSHRMAQLLITINEKGSAAFDLPTGEYQVWYHDGPVIVPSDDANPMAKVEVLATFGGTDATGMDPKMIGQIAAIGGTFGKGRLCATACHPEYFVFSYDQVKGLFRYVIGRDVTFPQRRRRDCARTVGIYYHSAAGIDSAQVLMALDDNPAVDVVVLDELDVSRGLLDHVDVLVLPSGDPANTERYFTPMTQDLMTAFVARGGRVVAWGSGAMCLPAGGTVCANGEDVVREVTKGLRK